MGLGLWAPHGEGQVSLKEVGAGDPRKIAMPRPKKRAATEKVRVTLDLTPQFYRRFEHLEKLVGAGSKANLLRQALQLYEYMAKRTLDGWSFQAIPPGDGEPENIVFLGAAPPQN